MAGKYSKLLFDSTKIPGMINNWCELNLEGESQIKEKNTDQRIMYTIINDSMEIKLDFIKAKGGALTIYPKVGKHQDISEKIAEDIYEHISPELTKSPFANGFSMKMDYDDFDTLIELLKSYNNIEILNYSKCEEVGKANYELYKLRSSLGDSVTLKYYLGTHRMQMQGKPLYLFNEIVSTIGEDEHNADAVVDAHIVMCKVDVTHDELNEELKCILGHDLYNYLTISHRALLNSSIVISKIRVDGLEDYSYITGQALRAYEGFMRKAMSRDLTVPRWIGKMFKQSAKSVDYVLKKEYTTGLDSKKIDIYEKMYNFYHKNRHPYMHGSEYDATTKLISSFDEAHEKLNDLLSAIKIHYASYCEA